MFEKLNESPKIMYFHQGRAPLTYPAALKELAEKMGKPDLLPQALEDTICNALKNLAVQLSLQKQPHSEDERIITAFYEWVQNIHNENLAPPQGAIYPNNIVYDMIAALRKLHRYIGLSNMNILLHFFLEGANARKISNGNTPPLEFIATSLVFEVILAVKVLLEKGSLSEKINQLFKEGNSIIEYIEPQKILEFILTELKKNALFGALSAKNIFNFKREKNGTTGANRYLIKESIQEGLKILKNHDPNTLPNDMKSMVDAIKTNCAVVLPCFEYAQKKSRKAVHVLAMWDASEWFERLHVALEIAARYDQQYKKALDEFTQHSIIADVLSRNQTGNFPAKKRDALLASVEIIPLFTQDIFAKIKTPVLTTELSVPVYSSVLSNPVTPSAADTKASSFLPAVPTQQNT